MNKRKTVFCALTVCFAAAFFIGCSDGDSKASSAASDANAGTLVWTGDASGKYTYKTATCTLDMDGNLAYVEAPHEVEASFSTDDPAPASLTEPYLNVGVGPTGVMVVFIPEPHNLSPRNKFMQVRDWGDGINREEKDGKYILHLRHFDDVANDFTKDPIPEWHVYLTGDIVCTKITNP